MSGGTLALVAGTAGGAGGTSTAGQTSYAGIAGDNGVVGVYAGTYTTAGGIPPSQTQNGGNGGYQVNTGSNITTNLPVNGGCCVISFS